MSDNEESNHNPERLAWGPGWKLPLITFAVVLAFYGSAWFYLLYHFINSPKISPEPGLRAELGQFGDAFGAINALFSALAFAAVATSLYLQGKEIRTSIKELIEANKNQRTSNLLNAIDGFNQINQSASFEPLHILYRSSERAVALQLFTSKLLLARLFAEDRSTAEDFPTVDALRLARDNANRLFGQADVIREEADKFRFVCTPEVLEEHEETFQQIKTNVLDCIAEERQKEFIDFRLQLLRSTIRQTSEGLQKPHVSGRFSTNDHSKLTKLLAKEYVVVACEITKVAMQSLGFRCEYTKEFNDWLMDKKPFDDSDEPN